jgi:GntR family transcriptional regulator, transcriptional repressor for pyruvate dehydrogenase complex
MFKPVEKGKRNYELVIEQLHLLIADGRLKPGDLILPERKLAEELNVSRTSVREALRILEALDVVYVKPGEGTFLKKPTMNGIIAPLLMFLQEDTESHSNLFETRTLLESGIARLAALRRTEEDLQEIGKYAYEIKETDDLEKVIQADINFHASVLKAAKNPTLTSFITIVQELMKHGIRKTRNILFTEPGENEISANYHIKIFHAIRDQDADAAYDAMYEHLEYTSNRSIVIQNQQKNRS